MTDIDTLRKSNSLLMKKVDDYIGQVRASGRVGQIKSYDQKCTKGFWNSHNEKYHGYTEKTEPKNPAAESIFKKIINFILRRLT